MSEFGNVPRVVNGNSIYNNVNEWKDYLFGTSREIERAHRDLDDRVGSRRGQPWVQLTTRVPAQRLVVRCVSGSGTNQPFQYNNFQPKHNITTVAIEKIHITGLAADTYPNLYLSLHGEDPNNLQNNCTTLLGCNSLRGEGVVIEGPEPGSTAVLVVPGAPLFLSKYMQPHTIENVSISLKDMSGNYVTFGEMVVWLDLESEIWQQ
jgi:hypothetical protein